MPLGLVFESIWRVLPARHSIAPPLSVGPCRKKKFGASDNTDSHRERARSVPDSGSSGGRIHPRTRFQRLGSSRGSRFGRGRTW